MNDRHQLTWKTTTLPLADLPPGIARHYIPTPQGKLEILSAQPPPSQSRKKALIFIHGGFGSASVWLQFMKFFSEKGYPCYAHSWRGHGGSWKPGYFQMVWMTGKASIAEDFGYAFSWVEGFEAAKQDRAVSGDDIVLIGHSAGGGLAQYFLSRGLGTVGGLVIMAAFPPFGGFGIYTKWFRLDAWFAPRFYLRDLWHPRSPLSSTNLVHRAFFSSTYPLSEVKKFESFMPEYESMLVPLGMMFPFADTKKVLCNVSNWESGSSRVLVIAGEKDTLVGVTLMQKAALLYRKCLSNLGLLNRVEEGVVDTGVTFAVVKHSGHHIQNDLYWEDCAGQVSAFLQQL